MDSFLSQPSITKKVLPTQTWWILARSSSGHKLELRLSDDHYTLFISKVSGPSDIVDYKPIRMLGDICIHTDLTKFIDVMKQNIDIALNHDFASYVAFNSH